MMTWIVDTIWNTSKDIVYSKRAALKKGEEAVVQQVGEGKDLMSILRMFYLAILCTPQAHIYTLIVRANMTASIEDRLPDEELIAQTA